MTYARARLWLGISSVGTLVVLATVALWLGLPERVLPSSSVPLRQELGYIAAAFLLYIALSAPFDLTGGLLLPRRFGRPADSRVLVTSWIRGVLAQGLWTLFLAMAILAAARWRGDVAAVAVVVAASLLLVASQTWFARAVGGLRFTPGGEGMTGELGRLGLDPASIRVVRHRDPGFTGGWAGLPGRESLLVPSSWFEILNQEELTAQVLRRIGVLRTGARSRGLAVALAWNIAGFALAVAWPGAPVSTVVGLVTVALLVTLWSFLGALLLPSMSRPAVFAADQFARLRGASDNVLSSTMRRLDATQDDEAQRPRLIETIFHPVPAPGSREERLGRRAGGSSGAWHAARMALFLSWACFGLLSRAVHCNCGRPELWVLLPAD